MEAADAHVVENVPEHQNNRNQRAIEQDQCVED
jgi:hypothetical protein